MGRSEQEQKQEREQEQERRSDSDDDSGGEQEEIWPAKAITGTEPEAAQALAAAWAEAQDLSGDVPVPDDEVKGYIKEYNELIPELCPGDGRGSRGAMKVAGTQASDGNGPATMRIRLARALLRLTRIDSSNYEVVRKDFEEALWLKRCRMEVLLRGRAPPNDDTGLQSEMLGDDYKDLEWTVLWPGGWGRHDKYHGTRADRNAAAGAAKRAKGCKHGVGGPCPQCELEKSWGSPTRERQSKRVRLDVGGEVIELCEEHKVGYEKGKGCPGCKAGAAQRAKGAGSWRTCDKHGEKVYFQGRCELCRAGGGSRSSGGTLDSANNNRQEKGGLSEVQRMQVMAKVMAKAMKGSLGKKKRASVKAVWAESSSSGSTRRSWQAWRCDSNA